ncbi:MAG: L-seryl-tRNA(Sec) selenium transferase [Synergistales bacterium]
MDERIRELLRRIPSMEVLLSESWIARYEEKVGRRAVKGVFSDIIGEIRKSLLKGNPVSTDIDHIRTLAGDRLSKVASASLVPVVNATGVVIHTNLGRSCLCDSAVKAVQECSSSYSTLEFDLGSGDRGQRNNHVEWLLCQVTGADSALVVNNNAGAVILCLSALSAGKESIVSRGELVEIGGSFRIPDIMTASGTHLVEVGTTNRTHLRDYEAVISENTAMILKVHPSNFRIVGFQSEVSREDLAALAREKDLIFMEDLGSGFLMDPESFGLRGEISVRDSVMAGVDLVTFSGDKMLGGPQAGIIAGRPQLIAKLRKHPLMRALRPDKMTLAALEATLREILSGNEKEIPTVGMISIAPEALRSKAIRLCRLLRRSCPEFSFSVVGVQDAVGGGSYPEIPLEGYAVSVLHPSLSSGVLQRKLRESDFPVVAGAREGALFLHVRTLRNRDFRFIRTALSGIAADVGGETDGKE